MSTIGAIIYLLAARKPAPFTEHGAPPVTSSVRTDDIADTVHGA